MPSLSAPRQVEELVRVTHTLPINIKLLQLQLQGCVSVSVNEGPGEIANVFLGENAKAKNYDPVQVKHLRSLFGRFLAACTEALKVNGDVIGPDQVRRGLNTEERWTPLLAHARYFIIV